MGSVGLEDANRVLGILKRCFVDAGNEHPPSGYNPKEIINSYWFGVGLKKFRSIMMEVTEIPDEGQAKEAKN